MIAAHECGLCILHANLLIDLFVQQFAGIQFNQEITLFDPGPFLYK